MSDHIRVLESGCLKLPKRIFGGIPLLKGQHIYSDSTIKIIEIMDIKHILMNTMSWPWALYWSEETKQNSKKSFIKELWHPG